MLGHRWLSLGVCSSLLAAVLPFAPMAVRSSAAAGRPEPPPMPASGVPAAGEAPATLAPSTTQGPSVGAARTYQDDVDGQRSRTAPVIARSSETIELRSTTQIATGWAAPVGFTRFVAGGPVAGDSESRRVAADRVRLLGLSSADADAAGLSVIGFSVIDGSVSVQPAGVLAMVHVRVDYLSFRHLFGGSWAGRLQLVALPGCVHSRPHYLREIIYANPGWGG